MGLREHLHDLAEARHAIWVDRLRGWLAYPDEIIECFAGEGFEEYRRELIRGRHDYRSLGGLWEALDRATGSIASVIWVNRPGPSQAIVFIDIDGKPLEGTAEAEMVTWWSELDDAVLRCLSDGALAPVDIGHRLGISEDAASSLVTLLATEGKVRICLVAVDVDRTTTVRSLWCPFQERQVTVEFRATVEPGKPAAVNWCSAFTPPTAIGCARPCLEVDGLLVAA